MFDEEGSAVATHVNGWAEETRSEDQKGVDTVPSAVALRPGVPSALGALASLGGAVLCFGIVAWIFETQAPLDLVATELGG